MEAKIDADRQRQEQMFQWMQNLDAKMGEPLPQALFLPPRPPKDTPVSTSIPMSTHSHTLAHTHSHTHQHTHSLTHTHQHTLTLTLTLTHTHQHTHTLTHTHQHTSTHTLTHTQLYLLYCLLNCNATSYICLNNSFCSYQVILSILCAGSIGGIKRCTS